MTCLIIDDERLARQEMRRLLECHPQIEILGEAGNGREAEKAISEHRPDVIFLDIEMPGQTGFELIGSLPDPIPLVVFVTAYDRHAVRAFDVHALDYLVKPVESERLAACVSRLEAILDIPDEPLQIAPLESAVAGSLIAPENSVLIREGDRFLLVNVEDIFLLESERNYTRVHFTGGVAMILRSLNALEARLPSSLFFRTNRSQVINIKHIAQLHMWFSQSIKAKLRDGREIEFSRRQALAFREQMSL
jgi:two-component system LytT family response regulator